MKRSKISSILAVIGAIMVFISFFFNPAVNFDLDFRWLYIPDNMASLLLYFIGIGSFLLMLAGAYYTFKEKSIIDEKRTLSPKVPCTVGGILLLFFLFEIRISGIKMDHKYEMIFILWFCSAIFAILSGVVYRESEFQKEE